MKISVIVPVYNASKYINRCIDSILNQNYKNIEIIVVDDGSTDNTLEKLKKYKDLIIVKQKNSGVSVARNKGLEKANGDYILFIDSDDYIDRKYISSLVNAALKTNSDIIETPLLFEALLKNKKRFYTEYKYKEVMIDNFNSYYNSDNKLRYVIGVLYKKDVIGDIKFHEDIRCYEDGIFNLEVKLKTNRYYLFNKPMYHYVQNVNSLSKSISDKHLDYIKVIEKLSIIYKDSNSKKYIENIFKDNIISILLFKVPYMFDNFKIRKKFIDSLKKYCPNFYKKHKIIIKFFNSKRLYNIYAYFINKINLNNIIFKIQSSLNRYNIKN